MTRRKTVRTKARMMQMETNKKETPLPQKSNGGRSILPGEKLTIKLAGIAIEIHCLYPSTKRFCRDYLTEAPADFAVEVTRADLAFEREKSARQDAAEGLAPRRYSDEYLETLAVYRKIAERLPDYDTLLFHGSAVAVDGAGYLFTAKSGTGKSTHTRLWRERFGPRAVMVNDDKPLLRVAETGVTVCGTPWDGKHRLSRNMEVPLSGLCLLSRSGDNRIGPVAPREAWPMLMQQTYRPADPAALAKTLALVDRLSRGVKLWSLGCNMEPEAAEVSYNAMRERKMEQ